VRSCCNYVSLFFPVTCLLGKSDRLLAKSHVFNIVQLDAEVHFLGWAERLDPIKRGPEVHHDIEE